MIELDKKYRLRDGREARVYAVDGANEYSVHGAYRNVDGRWMQESWTDEGCFSSVENHEHDLDLIEVKPRIKRTYWVNIYPKKDVENFWDNEQMAREAASASVIARVKVEIDVEEGHGLQ